jgi:hypothetical protein
MGWTSDSREKKFFFSLLSSNHPEVTALLVNG